MSLKDPNFIRTLKWGFQSRSRFFTFLGILPPYNFAEGKHEKFLLYKYKVFSLIVVITVASAVCLYERATLVDLEPIARVCIIFTHALNWAVIVVFMMITVTKREIFLDIFHELTAIEEKNNSPINAKEMASFRRDRIYFLLVHLIFLQYIFVYNYAFLSLTTRTFRLSMLILQIGIVQAYYVSMILYITIILLKSIKSKYTELNYMVAVLKHTKIYEEKTLLEHIKTVKHVFIKLAKTVDMFNQLLGQLMGIMPLSCSIATLEIFLHIKHTLPQYHDQIILPVTKISGGLILFVS